MAFETKPRAHQIEEERPLGSYRALTGAFAALASAFTWWMQRSGRELPDRISPGDLALMAVATHKASRLVAKDRVMAAVRAPFTEFQENAGPGEVAERATGSGLRRALGELLTCPYCIGLWIAALLAAGMIVAPKPTRWGAGVLTTLFASDVLHIGYVKLEEQL